jgi:dienelactone hydrolase
MMLCLLALLVGLLQFFPKFPTLWKSRVLPAGLGLTALAQIVFEGFRWQLWPVLIAAAALITLSQIKNHFQGRGLVVGLSICLAFISLLAGTLFPVPDPFPINGPYQVGTRVVHLVDPQRKELYGSDPEAPRELMAQVWYPAAPGPEDQQAQWMPAIEFAGPALAEMLNLPSFALDHLKYVQGNAYLEAPLIQSGESLPVLVFSHGWEGFKEQNIFQVEELASQGYLVIGLNHTYGAVLSVFPDGRQMPVNHQALPDEVSEEVYDLASNTLVKQWAGDIGLALDQLENPESNPALQFLAGRVDLSRIGVFGHSTGAGATVEFCLVDLRCQAALVMDLWAEPVDPEIQQLSLNQPILILHSENWDSLDTPQRNYGLIGTLVDRATRDVFEITIQGSKHYDFSSLPLLTPLAENLGLKGPINGELMLEIINAESTAFFNRYLRGDETINLEQLSGEYPEVLWGVRP